ncbi:hypothetical protein [Salinithrix halophila]
MFKPTCRSGAPGPYEFGSEPDEMQRLLLFLLIIPTIFWYAGALDDI